MLCGTLVAEVNLRNQVGRVRIVAHFPFRLRRFAPLPLCVFALKPGRTKISPKTCCTHELLCYIARPFPKVGRGTKTIYRQLFFVWLDNAFAFA